MTSIGMVSLRNIAMGRSVERQIGANVNENAQASLAHTLAQLLGDPLDLSADPIRLMNGTLTYSPVIGLFEPTDEDRGTYEMYNDQKVVSQHVEMSYASRGCAAGDLLALLGGYREVETYHTAANTRGLSGRGQNYSAASEEQVFYHDPYTPGPINTWSMLWEEGISDEYWEVTDSIVETINLSINTRAAVAISANMVGRYLIKRVGSGRVAENVEQRLTPDRIVGTNAEFYINGVSANSVSSAELVIATGMGPNWRVGEGLSWARPVRGRRAFMANITWLRDARGREEFDNFLNTERTEDVMEIIFPVEGSNVDGKPRFIAIQAQVRKNQNSQNPGQDNMELNTTQINYVSLEVLDANHRRTFGTNRPDYNSPLNHGFVVIADPPYQEGLPGAPNSYNMGAMVSQGGFNWTAIADIVGMSPPFDMTQWTQGDRITDGGAVNTNPSFRVITNIPSSEWAI